MKKIVFLTTSDAEYGFSLAGSVVSDQRSDGALFWGGQGAGFKAAAAGPLKGILAFTDDDDRYVFQGVHMMLEGDHQRKWKDVRLRNNRRQPIARLS